MKEIKISKYILVVILAFVCEDIFAQVIYTFNGDGNWTIPGNWSNNTIPPATISGDTTIIINPILGGSCILNTSQTVSRQSNIVISQNANFVIVGGLTYTLPQLYYGGSERNGQTAVAKIWMDGVETPLSNGTDGAKVEDFFVSGANVYSVGFTDNPNRNAIIWRNSVPFQLTNTNLGADALSVFIDGTDEYVCGWESNGSYSQAMLWENGTPATLSNTKSSAEAVFVSGTDVYVAGWETNQSTEVPMIWKNGIGTILPYTGAGHAYSVSVSGNDVYVAGDVSNGSFSTAMLWKNGIQIPLSTLSSSANSIFINGPDVYVAGTISYAALESTATVWKNGTPSSLDVLTPSYSISEKVFVKGNDVYVAGWQAYGSYLFGVVWFNGYVLFATDGTEQALMSSIFVR